MVSITSLEAYFSQGFQQVFGSIELAGLFGLFIFVLIAAFAGIDIAAFIPIFFILFTIFAAFGLLGGFSTYLLLILILVGGLIIFLAYKRINP